MLPSPLPESNYYVVFTKANSPSDPYASKTKLRPLSGTLSSLHRSILLQEPYSAHRKYLHQSPPTPIVSVAIRGEVGSAESRRMRKTGITCRLPCFISQLCTES